MERNNRHRQRHNQTADDQGCSSGNVQNPNVFPIEERFPKGLLRFLKIVNNPWNLALARRKAAPDGDSCVF
jgi:hypothetical protein